MKGALFFGLALVVALKTSVSSTACKSCSIAASDYDQSCVHDSDCLGIVEGNLCDGRCTDCVNAAINVRDRAKYQSDFSSKVSKAVNCLCPGAVVACNGGTCGPATFPVPPADAAAEAEGDAAADTGADVATDAADAGAE
jgi:hypothetical protein